MSELDRVEVMPVVESLLRSVMDDFLGCSVSDRGTVSLIDSWLTSRQSTKPAAAAKESIRRQDTPRPGSAKSITAPSSHHGGEEGLIRADYSKQGGSTVGHRATLATMMAEKSSLKRELRSLDVEFEQREGRKPTKAEKEHLRPLYVR